MSKDSQAQGPCIGIDLGTTYSWYVCLFLFIFLSFSFFLLLAYLLFSVGIWQNDRVEIIANDQGDRTTPSWVGFTETERLIGGAAKNQGNLNPQNTIFDAKRLIGRKFDDKVVQDDMKHWPFKVIRGDGNKPLIEVEYLGQKKTFTPEGTLFYSFFFPFFATSLFFFQLY